MKKYGFVVLFIFLLISPLLAVKKSLTMQVPSGGRLELRSEYTVTWRATGLTGTVRLILYKGSRGIGVIASGLNASSQRYRWTVGQYSGGFVSVGTGYKIRIALESGALFDDSNVGFEIYIAERDLKLNGIKTNSSGRLVALVQSNLKGFNGRLAVGVNTHRFRPVAVLKRVNLRVGRETALELIRVEPDPATPESHSRKYRVKLDQNMVIPETNEGNNMLNLPVFVYPTYGIIKHPIQVGGNVKLNINVRGAIYNIQRKHCYNADNDKREAHLVFLVDLANYGYRAIRTGRLKVIQMGNWQEGRGLPGPKNITRADVSVPLGAGEERNDYSVQVTLKRSNNSTVWFEYIWEEEGHHRRRSAVFSFKVTFNSF